MDGVLEFLTKLAYDASSRKFLVTILAGGAIVANYHYGWNMPFGSLVLLVCVSSIFVICEYIFDAMRASRGITAPQTPPVDYTDKVSRSVVDYSKPGGAV